MTIRKSCQNCWHYTNSSCSLHSSKCATEVLNKETSPSRWMNIKTGLSITEQQLIKQINKRRNK
jgi:hypothetical protein